MDCRGAPQVRAQAGLRLRELAQAQQDPAPDLGPVPLPLRPGQRVKVSDEPAPPLDASVARRTWLQLGIGGTAALVGALTIWLFVTVVTLAGMG